MGMTSLPEWRKLPISLTELCIDTTLRCGQSFRWKRSEDNVWSCALHGRIMSLRQDSKYLHYRAIYPIVHGAPPTPPSSAASSPIKTTLTDDDDATLALVRHYLNLEPNLTQLYEQWSSADENFKRKAPKFTGVRILKQDAWEALVGFICSSNNNIVRISQMVEKLCLHYGPLLGYIGSQAFHDFPQPAALTGPEVEQHLRALGFGYRAKYLHRTAVMVAKEREDGWLDSLRNPESPVLGRRPAPAGEMMEGGREGYRTAHEQVLQLRGVGPKVADCVCLMGLSWGEAVPVDTHVWQIAQRDYKFGKGKHSSLTKATYDAVGNRFRSLWGSEAGWAHSVLFTADLRAFSERLALKIERTEELEAVKKEMDSVAVVEDVKSLDVITAITVKRELEDDTNQALNVLEKVESKRVKRRRKA